MATLIQQYGIPLQQGGTSLPPVLADEVARGQWHLAKLGGLDKVWADYSGRGVKVAIYDSGVQSAHWDLAANYDASLHLSIDGKTYDGDYRPESGGRGTSLAGLVVATNDGAGAVGVAYGAKLTGVNVFDPYSGEGLDPGIWINASGSALFMEALRHRVKFDVIVDGWARAQPDFSSASSRGVAGTDASRVAAAFEFAAEKGRGGLGTISIHGSGNTGLDAQADSGATSRHTISVGAYREDGYAATTSARGPSLLVSAPSGDLASTGAPGLVTTDLLGRFGANTRDDPGGLHDHTDALRGTAAAAAGVSGIVALMLESNPGLGWRDVQGILASSASLPIDWNDRTRSVEIGGVNPDGSPMTAELNESFFAVSGRSKADWNGGGYHYSNDYGYGAVNAHDAVRMAEVASLLGGPRTSANEMAISTDVMIIGMEAPNTQYDASVYGQDFVGEPAEFRFEIGTGIDVEHVDLTLTYSFDFFGQQESIWTGSIKLVAPDGASAFVDTSGTARTRVSGDQSFTFGLTNFRGAETKGVWKIQFENTSDATLRIETAKVELYGGQQDSDDVHVYTDEFLTMARVDPDGGRRLLSDTNGGADWINAAAVTADVNLSLVAGARTTFDGVGGFTITRASRVENAITGDGADVLTGNAGDNILFGMRGDDTLDGGRGNDTLAGGSGADLFRFGVASGGDRILDWEDNDTIETTVRIAGTDAQGFVTVSRDQLLRLEEGGSIELTGQAGAVLRWLGETGGYQRYGWVSGNAVDHAAVMKIAPAPRPTPAPDATGVAEGGETVPPPSPTETSTLNEARWATLGVAPGGVQVDSLGRNHENLPAGKGPRYTTWGPETLGPAVAAVPLSQTGVPLGITDPFAAEQWHLRKLGDMDTVWADYTGKGVKVGVYDSGVQYAHPDLAPNYDASLHVRVDGEVYDGDFRPVSGAHGTSVAGLIAAARNGIGTVGVAYDASLTGVNIFDPYSGGGLDPGITVNNRTPAKFFEAMRQGATFDVVNHSWGGSQPFYATDQSRGAEGTFANQLSKAFAYVAATGRGGLGTVSLMAAGNLPMDTQADSPQTDRHVISVAAYRELDGLASNYSARGAGLFISGPSNDRAVIGGTGVVATDLMWREGYNLASAPGGDYDHTDQFGGTSAATPIVTGVVALMLDANAGLGWRDVKSVLASSAKLPIAWDNRTRYLEYTDEFGPGVATMNESWFKVTGRSGANWNGGGYHYSTDYGFGAVDALAAVRMAEVWSLFGNAATSANEAHFATDVMKVGIETTPLSDYDRDMMHTDFISEPQGFSFEMKNIDLTIEHVDMTLTYTGLISFGGEPLPFGFSGPNRMKLIAPDGTEAFVDATLVVPSGDQSDQQQTFTFGFSAFRGVDPDGTWVLQFESKGAGYLIVDSVKVDLYGAQTSTDDLYTYTNDFSTMAAVTGEDARRILSDRDGGNDWINAAAVSRDVTLSLVEGGTTRFGGVDAFTIASGSRIEHAVTGDGNDRLMGNALDNRLYGMRGDDWLNGSVGNDTLFGGRGADVFAFDTAGVSGFDSILDWSTGDRIATSKQLRGADQNGLVTIGASAMILLDNSVRGDTAELAGQGGAVLQALGKSDGYWWYGFVSAGSKDYVDEHVIELALGQTGQPANDVAAGLAAGDTSAADSTMHLQDTAFYLYQTMGDAMASGVAIYA